MKEKKFSIERALENVGSLAEQTDDKTDWRYVNRPDKQIDRIARILNSQSQQQKFLLAGQDGCGKTTELNRLQELMAPCYTVVRCDHRHFHDLNDAEEIEFLFVLLRAFMSAAEKRAPAAQNQIKSAFQKIFKTSSIAELLIDTVMGTTLSSPVILTREDALKEASIRAEFRTFRSELNSSVHKAIEVLQEQYGKPIFLIVDDLEKFQEEHVSKLITENYKILSSFPCAILYTVPLGLLFSDKLQALYDVFHVINLANVPLINKRDENIKSGWQFLEDTAGKRLDIFWLDLDKAIRKAIIFASGGNLRRFLSILGSLLVDAAESPSKKIETRHVKQNFLQLVSGFRRFHNREDREILENVRATKEFNYSLPRRLLHNFSIMEYWHPDAGAWYDVNPLVLPDHPFNPLKVFLNEEDIVIT
ncbi:MAG: AAA family ATPase [bacterium]|nr:AAA family ATPase [bacterium]